MSILKAIMHHYNATTKNYDTLHPETEASQITDWHSSIMASLASKTLGTVVDAVTTDSVLGKLIKLLLNASGVKYLIDTNGYICFGSFFGGVILQWGTQNSGEDKCILPIAFTITKINSIGIHFGNSCINVIESYDNSTSLTKTGFRRFTKDGTINNDAMVRWISIGK